MEKSDNNVLGRLPKDGKAQDENFQVSETVCQSSGQSKQRIIALQIRPYVYLGEQIEGHFIVRGIHR